MDSRLYFPCNNKLFKFILLSILMVSAIFSNNIQVAHAAALQQPNSPFSALAPRTTSFPAHTSQATLPGLSILGTNIIADGQPIRLRGINMGDPFWARNPDWYSYSPADYQVLSQEWRANVVRISIFPTQWKNMNQTALLSGLSQEIDAALNNGMYVIISYHVIGWPNGFYQEAYPGNPADTYDSSMSVATSFWNAMAQTYGSDTRIIFDLWNEPVHPDDFTLYGSNPNPLWPVLKSHYESLIETVRTNGAENIVIATGNRWASWLVGIKDNLLTDPNVVYAYHKYSVEGLNNATEWDKDTGGLIGLKPVIVSEWGYEDTDAGANPTWPGSQSSYGEPFTKWLESKNLSNLAWMYHDDWTPALLEPDGSLTKYGSFIKQYISGSETVRFAAIGDFGSAGQPEADVANLVKSWNPDLIVTLGDNNYPSGSASSIDTNIGQYYHEFIYTYTGSFGAGGAANNFYPALGNHDWETTNAQPYLNYFSLPVNPNNHERYYDFVRGPVHFFMLDSDSREPDGITSSSVQATWLQNALSASSSPWKIVLLHHAPFSSSSQHGSNATLQWPYQAWGADAVLAGHDHTYERIVINEFPYFVNGLGGHPTIYNFGAPVTGSRLRYNANYGAMQVNATSANINFQFINRSGTVVDSYTLSKAGAPSILGGCQIFPADNIWNTPIDNLPVHSLSDDWIDTIGRNTGFHMDFGSGIWPPVTGGPIGIPYNLVNGSAVTNYTLQAYLPADYPHESWLDESDPGPYPIPASPAIEAGGDRHILVVDTETCTLNEIYDAEYRSGQWYAGSGAIWDLNSNALRPDTWTSADAAGLPILPGLVRYEEIVDGEINHALRFTAEQTAGYIWPARHQTSAPESGTPPMGARFRLKAAFDISGYSPEMQVLLNAMKTYGIILADNGSDWYVSGAPSEDWDNDMLHELDDITGDDFEAVDASSLMVDPDSGEAQAAGPSGAPDPAKLSFQEIASGLSAPVFITNAGDGSGRIFIVEQTGNIRIIKNGTLLATPFLDLHSAISPGGEKGLLALAFHPSYSTNGEFFVAYNAPRSGDTNGSNLVLKKFTVSSGNPDIADPGSGTTVMIISHPTHSNHNGGTLAFGQDGYLYWSTGDGGSGGDPNNNAQNLSSLLGKMLRIDINNTGAPAGCDISGISPKNYAIPTGPSGNPFSDGAGGQCDEIWSYGLRNPWRFSFDSLTHDLFIGDVGQSAREEINFRLANSTGGENYGWRLMEGSLCYNPSSGCNPLNNKILPVAEYSHALGCSVTGGYVYRGSNFPSLYGYYFYGDFCTGRFFSLYNDSGWTATQIADTPYSISTFGEDEQKELYLADYGTGKIYNIQYEEPITISGNVGVAGATLSYTDGIAKTDTSDSNGNYSFAVSDGWDGTVTPSKTCYIFTPSDRSYTDVTASQTSQDYDYTLDPTPACPDIEVSVGKISQGLYDLTAETTSKQTYASVLNGPLRVLDTSGAPLFTSQVVTSGESYNELMGYPNNQLHTEYWFPWYDHGYPGVSGSTMRTWLAIGNPHATLTADVDVYIGGIFRANYDIAPGGQATPRWIGLQDGPVRIVSTNGVDIFASQRVFTAPDNSFNESMGYPSDQFVTEYWFPWYDTVYMNSSLMIGNTSSSTPANVSVYIGGVFKGSYVIGINDTLIQNYAGLINGPVRVVGTNGVNIVVSQRVRSGPKNSYNEVMGYPNNQFHTEYWFPWYDHGYSTVGGSNMRTWLAIGNPHATLTADVDVYIDGVFKANYDIPAGGQVTPRWIGLQDGPVQIISTNGVDIFASQRVFTVPNSVFNEMLGFPADQFTSQYWFPWYDTVFMNSSIFLSKP